MDRAINIKTATGSLIREEYGNLILEERSPTLFGKKRFQVYRRGKQNKDGSTQLNVIGWFDSYAEARNKMFQLEVPRTAEEGDEATDNGRNTGGKSYL